MLIKKKQQIKSGSLCLLPLFLIAVVYVLSSDTKFNNQFDAIENESQETIRFGVNIPFYILFNDNYYYCTGENLHDEKVREIGSDQLKDGGSIYEIEGISPLKKVALKIHNSYMVFDIKEDFTESEAISSVLLLTNLEIGGLGFLDKPGEKISIIEVNNPNSDQDKIKVPIQLETQIERIGKYKYRLTLSESWESKYYNPKSESSEILKHFWVFDVTPGRSILVDEGGSQSELLVD